MNFLTSKGSECPRCHHPQTPEVHGLNVLEQTQCKKCPNGLCTEAAENVDPAMTVAGNGLALIHEMSKRDLVEELALAQRGYLMECSLEQLREYVVQTRLQMVRKRLMAEAGITEGPRGIFDL